MQPSSSTYPIKITPLGAGQEVGRSCIVCQIKDRTIIFDSGIHMQYNDNNKYPDFKHILNMKQRNHINDCVDAVILTHFHLDHCGGLPYLTHHYGYSGPVYATLPTKAMIPYMLQDFRKVSTDLRKDKQTNNTYIYTASEGKLAAERITSIALEETITYKGIKITPYYAGHVLGAGMFFIEYEGLSILYTGDYNSYADRHLGAATAPRLNPNIIITQTTYATTIRDTKRDRQRKMLKIVSQTVENGGKVLIPVFALGRAQQLSVLLQTYWNRTQSQIPVYFSAGLIQKANFYYKLFVEWQNQKIKQDFLTNNLFNFKKVKPFDKSLIRADIPYVLFATPGMLHGGTSLQIFKQWCGNPKNTIIIPGYCVPGTFGNKLLNKITKLQIDGRLYEVNMKVQNISFSAHADAKGIINLIRHVNAQNIVFVHGDAQKMKVFEDVVRGQLIGKDVFRPANKETISINCTVRNYVKIDNNEVQPGSTGYMMKGNKNENNHYKFVDEENFLKQVNMMRDLLGCSNCTIIDEQINSTFELNEQKTPSNEELEQILNKFRLTKVIKQTTIKHEYQIKEEQIYKNQKVCINGQINNVIHVAELLQ